MQHEETKTELGIKVHNISDLEEISRAEELTAVDDEWTKIAGRSKYGDAVDVVKFKQLKGVRLKYRSTPLADMTTRNLERGYPIEFSPTYCMECGIEIEPDEYAWFIAGKHYCKACGQLIYAEQPEEGDELMCSRCDGDIDNNDDIFGFEEVDTSEESCMCSRCAYIRHRMPLWEAYLKQT